jgi:plasmid replication initiation protein
MQQDETINTLETLGVTPRFVLQHNAISRSVHNLSATAKKLTVMAMALIQPDLSSLTATFSFNDFCKAIGYNCGGKSFKLFKEAVKECFENKIYIEVKSPKTGKKIWEGYTWFTYSKIDEETGMCTMKFSKELANILAEMKRVYSKINLQDIGQLQSKYALRIFEIAKSYESLAGKDGNKIGTWYFERSVEDFRLMLGVPDNVYPETKYFRQFVIENPVKEINAACIGMKIEAEGIKQGRNLKAIRLNCTKKPTKTPVRQGRKKKASVATLDLPENSVAYPESRFEKELEHLKELYPAEFTELYEDELANNSVDCVSEFANQEAAKWNALNRLKKRHGIVK